jgi:glycine cleavage system aminomethyltransferase T
VTAAERALRDGAEVARLIKRSARTISPTPRIPFGTAQEIEIGMGLARAHRVTYVGELGWELYVSTDQAAHVFEAIEEAGSDLGLKLCGLHTLDSCRIEKAFRHFGHDITDEDHVLEAGLGFAVKTAKGDFIGRDAVLRKEEEGPVAPHGAVPADRSRAAAVPQRGDRARRQDRRHGHSGNYGHFLGGAIGMGYVPAGARARRTCSVRPTRSRIRR